MRFADMDGKKFSDALEEQVRVYEKEIDDRLASISSRKQSKWRERTKAKLQCVKSEISALRESDTTYDLKIYEKRSGVGEKDLRGFVSYDQESDVFIVNVNSFFDSNTEGSFLGAFAHELKHAYQYEMCGLSFEETNKGIGITSTPGILYDYMDEVEAHDRGKMFGGIGNPEKSYYGNLKNKSESMTEALYEQYVFLITHKNDGKVKRNYFNGCVW